MPGSLCLTARATLPLVYLLVWHSCGSTIEARSNVLPEVWVLDLHSADTFSAHRSMSLPLRSAFLIRRGGNLESTATATKGLVGEESEAADILDTTSRKASQETDDSATSQLGNETEIISTEDDKTQHVSIIRLENDSDESSKGKAKNPLVNRWKRFQDGRRRRKQNHDNMTDEESVPNNATVHMKVADSADQGSSDNSTDVELVGTCEDSDTEMDESSTKGMLYNSTEREHDGNEEEAAALSSESSVKSTESSSHSSDSTLLPTIPATQNETTTKTTATFSEIGTDKEASDERNSLNPLAAPEESGEERSGMNDEADPISTPVEDEDVKESSTSTAIMASDEAEKDSDAEPAGDQTSERVDDDDEDSEEQNKSLSAGELYSRTQTLRKQGKELHDSKHYEQAAQSFALAARGLDDLEQRQQQAQMASNDDSDAEEEHDESLFDVGIHRVQEDAATCRLHESLCHFKAENFDEAVTACNQVIMIATHHGLSPAVRARALYRRAKARLALEQYTEATQDARSAAFLGDDKAVDLYGQLLRENKQNDGSGSSASLTSTSSDMPAFDGTGGFEMSPSLSESAPPSSAAGADLFSALMGGSPGGSDDVASSMLAKSLLSSALSSSESPAEGMPSPFGFSSLLGKGMGAGGMSSIVKSLGSRLTDEKLHDKICSTLQGASKTRIIQYAGVAGVDVSESQAERLAGICQKIKPRHLKTTVSIGKRLWYCGQLMRKTSAVLTKYRPILILIFLLFWIKTLFV